MLPIIGEEHKDIVMQELLGDVNAWRKSMIHYIKEENPEVNSAIIDVANSTDHDPKAVALGAYMIYKILEVAASEQGSMIEKYLE